MSDIEVLSGESSSERSEVISSSDEQGDGDYFELNGNFVIRSVYYFLRKYFRAF